MRKSEEYRLKIYELLYEKPICKYAELTDGKMIQNVLISGDEWACDEVYKSVFWAGESWDSELNITVASENTFEDRKYNYVMICFEDVKQSYDSALQIVSLMAEAGGRGIINIIEEITGSVEIEDKRQLIETGRQNGIEIHFWSGDPIVESELKRMAFNIHFCYGMKYNQRASKKQMAEQFERDLASDSSIASAVHIPVKLELCKSANPDADPLFTLKEAIRTKNDLYKKLVCLEHKRWNAYMTMQGFRAPTPEEEKYLYRDGNDHQDKKRRLHICLCDCEDLNRASLRVHQITSRLSEKIDIEKILRMVVGDNQEYINLRRAIIKLKNDEENSLPLYQKSLETALTYAETISEEEMKSLKLVDEILLTVKVRNSKIDFFSLDMQLVDMLPFVLWYGKKYRTVITISDGTDTAISDVIIPTLFCAEKAIFAGEGTGDKKYQNIIENYFHDRGANTAVSFMTIDSMDVEHIYSCVEEQILKIGAENLIINCVQSKGYEALLAIGKLMGKYKEALNVVQYLPDKGIVSFSSDKNIGVGLENKSFSLAEYIHLMGGRFVNEYDGLYDTAQYDSLLEFFRTYSVNITVKNEKGVEKKMNPWIEMNRFFLTVCKDQSLEKRIRGKNTETEVKHYSATFTEKVFIENTVGKTLRQLEEYRVIRNYKYQIEDDEVAVEFDYVDSEIRSVFQMFEKGKITFENAYKNLKFIAVKDGLKISDCRIQNQRLYEKNEPKELIKIKKAFMSDLEKRGYISELTIGNDGMVSFVFKDEATMRLLKYQGAIFELAVYHMMSESCLFDDVKTGVKISWDADEITMDKMLKEKLENFGQEEFGYKVYLHARKKLAGMQYTKQAQYVSNEIDVIAIKGMNAIMVSCKTPENASMQWIYEIKSVAEHFQATGVMAVSSNCNDSNRLGFMERGEKMGIPIWGSEILWDNTERKKAFEALVKQFA